MAEPAPASAAAAQQTRERRIFGLLRLRLWIAERIRPNELQITLLWAGVIGFLGACSAVAFRALADVVHLLATGMAGDPAETFSHLPYWQRVLTPTVGGLIAGAIIFFGSRFRGAVNSTDYMEAISLGDGRIAGRSSLVKCLSALFTIASGGSIGREGPMVQLSTLLSSLVGRKGDWTPPTRRLLVACGAAAGIASAYNAPIAGALFVAEIILGSMAMEIFGPLVFSSVVATLTVRAFVGTEPLYNIPHFELVSTFEIFPYLVLGLVSGLLAPWFLRLLRVSEGVFAKLRLPVYLRMALGGFIVGGLAILQPQVCGNGYTAVTQILHGDVLWQSLLLILVFKMIATAATFGSGAVGGVFTPTLFVGASLGYLAGLAVKAIPFFSTTNPSAFALVGMGAFLAATTHAPIMAILMLFELTLDYQIILPLMLVSVVAYYTSRSVEERSIYSDSLKRKGADRFQQRLAELHVRDLMKPDPLVVGESARFAEIGGTFVKHRFTYLYVTDAVGHFVGAISLHDIKNYLNHPEIAELVIARDIMREDFPIVDPELPLALALGRFSQHDGERLPVVETSGENRLIGSLSKTDVILALASQSTDGAAQAVAQATA